MIQEFESLDDQENGDIPDLTLHPLPTLSLQKRDNEDLGQLQEIAENNSIEQNGIGGGTTMREEMDGKVRTDITKEKEDF